jgi:uncharacterized protein YukE
VNSSAYVNSEALMSWKANMESINSQCIDSLDDFKSSASKLSSGWEGKSAEAFDREITSCVDVAKNMHEAMRDIDGFLETVVITSQNQ